ncbi:MAG: hypothetical protein WB757_06975 [Candidatus Cybelea sp.]|jgi:hypothetical protein
MIWSAAGALLALLLAAVAWRRSRSKGGFYDVEVYAMTPQIHRRYALLSLAFAAYFAATLALHKASAGIAGLVLYALIAVLYATSFLQGAPDRDE